MGGQFFTRSNGLYATPLFVVLLVVETSDILFAVDSIPAVLAITLNAFIVYTSNVFAILGLRSMYFALAGMMDLFHYLHYGLSVVLIFIGLKMLGSHYVNIPTGWALAIVLLVLGASILASLLNPKRKRRSKTLTPVARVKVRTARSLPQRTQRSPRNPEHPYVMMNIHD